MKVSSLFRQFWSVGIIYLASCTAPPGEKSTVETSRKISAPLPVNDFATGISAKSVKDLTKKIDYIASQAIKERAAPSVSVLVIKSGTIIINTAYGTHSYTDRQTARITDIYDLASLTKTSATTLAVMRLYEQGKIKLDATVGEYIPSTRGTNKSQIKVRDLMLHQAGLVAHIPFHLRLKKADYQTDSSSAFPTQVADRFFVRKGYFEQEMWPAMLSSKLGKSGRYLYSDLSMYFMKEIVERQSGKSLEKYVDEQFYAPLGMKRTGFNPRKRFVASEIIPTQHDKTFRKTLLRGFVHDEGAALAGGVSGHAGLFGTTGELGILYQMLLNRGSYDGKQFFEPETVDMFTSKHSSVSRRGLGFDRWDPDRRRSFPSRLASSQTYGHTGFTGTCVWVDPKYDLVYIFLSNRIHPDLSDKLNKLNIRGRIQDEIYKAISK